MARTAITYVRAGDTEPLEITVSAVGVTDLTAATNAVLYARETSGSTNHVTAGACTIPDTAEMVVSFDPVDAKVGGGNAFDAPGTYRCYVRITWSDGDTTRHPAKDDGTLDITVTESYEAA